jgi:uncharacterized protein (DUF58 family)
VEHESPWRGFLTAVAALAGLLGLASGTAALVGFALGWAALLVLAAAVSRRSLGSAQVRRRTAASAFEGDLLTVDVLLENHGRRPLRFALVEDVFGAGLADRQAVLEPGPLPPLHRRVLSYRTFVARQWGVYTVGPLSVGRQDPLGLFLARRKLTRLDPFEVFPKAVEVEALSASGGRSRVVPRDVTAPAAGQSLLFRGVREFQAGDDVRRIHWPATARRGTPMVREHERDLQPVFTLFLDLDRRGRAGLGRKSALEYLVRVGASILWTAHRRGDAFALAAQADEPFVLLPAVGEGHLATALHHLVIARQSGRVPLLDVVEQHRDLTPPGATAALLASTTEMDLDQLERTLDALRATAARPLVVVVDSLAFPPVDRPPTPAEVARELRTALGERLRSLDVPAAILGPDDTPEDALRRPDFFGLGLEAGA